MEIKKFNVSKPKKYQDKQGVEKTQWNHIGQITEFYKDDGSVSRIIEIPAIGLEANIFPFVEKEQNNNQQSGYGVKTQSYGNAPTEESQEDFPVDDINPSDIPF